MHYNHCVKTKMKKWIKFVSSNKNTKKVTLGRCNFLFISVSLQTELNEQYGHSIRHNALSIQGKRLIHLDNSCCYSIVVGFVYENFVLTYGLQ